MKTYDWVNKDWPDMRCVTCDKKFEEDEVYQVFGFLGWGGYTYAHPNCSFMQVWRWDEVNGKRIIDD